MDLQLDHKKVEKTEQLFPRQSQLDDHALLTFVINREMAMKENAAVVLQVCARDSLAARTIGVERSGPQNDIVAVEGAIALANGHGGLPGVVPDGGEAIRFGIEAGDSGASALGSVGFEEDKIGLQKLAVLDHVLLAGAFRHFRGAVLREERLDDVPIAHKLREQLLTGTWGVRRLILIVGLLRDCDCGRSDKQRCDAPFREVPQVSHGAR